MKTTTEVRKEDNAAKQAERRREIRSLEKARQRELDGDLTMWADVIVFRAKNAGSMYPPVVEGNRGGDGSGIPAIASAFISVDMRIRSAGTPRCVQAIWIRQYGGSDLRRMREVIEEVFPGLDSKAMAETVRKWRKAVMRGEDNRSRCKSA